MLATKNKIPSDTRARVYERDEFRCILCRGALSQAIHLHHAIPRSRGGGNWETNLVCLCPVCHEIAHGHYELKNQFPFDRETARDAILYYLVYNYDPDETTPVSLQLGYDAWQSRPDPF